MEIFYHNRRNELSNWDGTVKINLQYLPRKSRHYVPGVGYIWRYDIWFSYAGANYWGVQYGENTTAFRCKRIRGK